MERYQRIFKESDKYPGFSGVYQALVDGFDIDKHVAEIYATKLAKLKQHERTNEKLIASILGDILPSHANVKKAINMIIDEL